MQEPRNIGDADIARYIHKLKYQARTWRSIAKELDTTVSKVKTKYYKVYPYPNYSPEIDK